jgi:hypothetical protein
MKSGNISERMTADFSDSTIQTPSLSNTDLTDETDVFPEHELDESDELFISESRIGEGSARRPEGESQLENFLFVGLVRFSP